VLSEQVVEQAALGWFEALGFNTYSGAEISTGVLDPMRGYEDVVLETQLKAAIRRINQHLPEDAVEHAVRVITRPPEITLEANNRWFHDLLIDGIEVEYRTAEGDLRGDRARLVDFDNAQQNSYVVVHQLTVRYGSSTRRADLVVFLNGLPIVVIELKDPTNDRVDLWRAYGQLQDYKERVPSLFIYNELMVISDGDSTRVGSLTAGPDRFAPWRSIDDDRFPGQPTLEALIRGLFEHRQLLDYLRFCVAFEEDPRTGRIIKRSAAYHQFRAMLRSRTSVKNALQPGGDGRGGVVWHTQGSGKSLTMLMLAGALVSDDEMSNPTIVVVTDRNDLDGQLFRTFSAGRALLRQRPEQASDREDLARRLNRASGGVVFTTIQKFERRPTWISARSNIVVLADEAHRSQYGFEEGGARWMRDMLPNATYIGFTGTPIETDDRNTPAVFGKYADVYDIRQSIEDNATVPIYYEMRLVKLLPDEAGIAEAQRYIDAAAEADDYSGGVPTGIEVPLGELIGASERLKVVARQIVDHFEKRREVIEGKAMVVCMSRIICMDLYDEIIELRPEWHETGFVRVVMTGSAAEGTRVAQHARTKSERDSLARLFVDPESSFRLVIVCDMWLTGFDCPPMHTMYLDKSLAGHNLMQAIARVNRVFGDKPGGVVVDFLGIADQLRDVVRTYTLAGGEGSPVLSVQDEAIPMMQRYYETLQDFFYGLDYGTFVGGNAADQLSAVTVGADYVLKQENGKHRFLNMVASLSKAFALAVPLRETEEVRDPLVYFQAVRAAIRKRLSDSGTPRPDTRAAVRQVISGAIVSDGVIDLFQAAGISEVNVGILSEEFLAQIGSLPQKNLALETLRKLLNDEISSREHVNLVQSRNFRESLEDVLKRYTNRAITTAQVVDELIHLARTIREEVHRGRESGLTEEEFAFYEALGDNQSARQVMQDEQLMLIARQLSDRIKARATLDWTQRESVRADIRRTVRRLLAKHGYPPDAQETATQLIIKQAELMTEASVGSGMATPYAS
jgi:type I restriction enzyme R subunit